MRYRKRPVTVDAIRFDGTNAREIADLLDWEWADGDEICDTLVIETLEGDMTANIGDWIIKGVAGEGYPCRDDVFQLSYEPAEET